MKNKCRICKKIIEKNQYEFFSKAWDKEEIECYECLKELVEKREREKRI